MKKNHFKTRLFCFYLMILAILIIEIISNSYLLKNFDDSNYKDILSLKPSQTTVYEETPYGSFAATSSNQILGEHYYFEWNVSTLYGPGLTLYMMNDTECLELIELKNIWRTRGNFSYTELLSDEELSASGTFYPPYADTWWFVEIAHYTGINCSINGGGNWMEDFIKIVEPTKTSSWAINTKHYINWTWGGDFSFVNIDLYYNGNFSTPIAKNTKNNGSYLWTIPNNISLFKDLFQINISNSDYSKTWNISESYLKIYKSYSVLDIPSYNLWVFLLTIIIIMIILCLFKKSDYLKKSN